MAFLTHPLFFHFPHPSSSRSHPLPLPLHPVEGPCGALTWILAWFNYLLSKSFQIIELETKLNGKLPLSQGSFFCFLRLHEPSLDSKSICFKFNIQIGLRVFCLVCHCWYTASEILAKFLLNQHSNTSQTFSNSSELRGALPPFSSKRIFHYRSLNTATQD